MPMAVWLLAQLGLNGIVTGSLYAVLAISFAMIYAPTKTFHFAHGNVYVFAAYFLYQFAVVWGWPWVGRDSGHAASPPRCWACWWTASSTRRCAGAAPA